VVILSDYGKGGLAHITEMIARARAAGKPVLVDPKGEDYAPLCRRDLADAESFRTAPGGRPLARRCGTGAEGQIACARELNWTPCW
jgi:hypothetical protein